MKRIVQLRMAKVVWAEAHYEELHLYSAEDEVENILWNTDLHIEEYYIPEDSSYYVEVLEA